MPEIPEDTKDLEKYLDVVASLIMACPNLERLVGFYYPYDHEYSRYVQALSTRRKLAEKVWVINPSPYAKRPRISDASVKSAKSAKTPALAPSLLPPDQSKLFLSHHTNWTSLTSLLLHCNTGGIIDHSLFISTFAALPSLSHLHLSKFPANSFTDETLNALPALNSLRLDSMLGVTDTGISRFVGRSESHSLQSFSLIDTPLLSLPVLARLFSSLISLTKFTILQTPAPHLAEETSIWLQPYLASNSLKYLHWEVAAPNNRATQVLAKSIEASGFPALRKLRAPCDHDGALQALCRPLFVVDFPLQIANPSRSPVAPNPNGRFMSPVRTFSNDRKMSNDRGRKSPESTVSSRHGSTNGMAVTTSSTVGTNPRSLFAARQRAQARIDVAKFKPQYEIRVFDDTGLLTEKLEVGGYLGNMTSKIEYDLSSDVAGSDQAVVSVENLLGGERDVAFAQDVCDGGWNKGHVRGKKGWMHVERPRWRVLDLERFF